MQSRNAVYRVTCRDSKMRHLHLAVIDDRHLTHFLLITRIHLLNTRYESAVDLFYDLIYTGKQSGEQFDRPFLQRFCHDCMICISTGLRRNFPCLFPCQIIFIHQNTHQFRNRHRRVRIIQLECYLLMEFSDIVMLPHIFLNSFLYGGGNKEILLL